MEAETTYDEAYRCGTCDLMSVSMDTEWSGHGISSKGECLFAVYTCKKCGAECSLDTDLRSNDKNDGDTIDF